MTDEPVSVPFTLEQPGPPHDRYSVEPHGKGFAIYRGRDRRHHGFNLGQLSECDAVLPDLIAAALNAYQQHSTPRCDDAAPDKALSPARIHERLRERTDNLVQKAIKAAQEPSATDGEALLSMNDKLCDFATRWALAGDYLRCRTCNRPQIASCAAMDFPHAANCGAAAAVESGPWQTLVAILWPLIQRHAPQQREGARGRFYWERQYRNMDDEDVIEFTEDSVRPRYGDGWELKHTGHAPRSDDAPRESATSEAAHPDDVAVDQFAAALKAKLAEARAKGRGGWQNDEPGMQQRLSDMLRAHVSKGDPRDVANFCMFLHQRGEAILPAREVAVRSAEHIREERMFAASRAGTAHMVQKAIEAAQQPAAWRTQGEDGWEYCDAAPGRTPHGASTPGMKWEALYTHPAPQQREGATDGGRNMLFDGLFPGETERQRSARLAWANDMRAAFERHTGNGWFDKDWYRETGIWSAAWSAARSAPLRPVTDEDVFVAMKFLSEGAGIREVLESFRSRLAGEGA